MKIPEKELELNKETLDLCEKHNNVLEYESVQFFKDVGLLLDRKRLYIMRRITSKERKNKLGNINKTTNTNEENTI